MTNTNTCPRCGTTIRSDAGPAGLCAACLMKMGLESRSGAPNVVFSEAERADRPPPPTIAELAPHFPELELIELVGRGGMGAVYRAKQRSLQRDVALKILTVGAGDATFADRFQREARTLASLSHPGIVAVFDFGARGPWSFLAMEFVEGASLRQMMRAKTLGTRESLAIVSQMCEALQYAHDQGVVHRDIKPENVLVTRDGRVKVLDFGLAKLVGNSAVAQNLTQPSQVMGTPHYMAPEQWEKPLTVDHRADIYAMGVVFYELLTGELPLGRFEPPSHKVTLDLRLDDVVLRSLEKEPNRRYQHASQVRDDVAGITSTPGGVVAPVIPPKTRSSKHKLLVMGAGLGCFLLLLVPLGFTFLLFTGKNRSDLAEAAARETLNDSVQGQGTGRDSVEALPTTSGAAIELFGLDPSRDVPTIDEVAATGLGLNADQASKLDAAFAGIWRRYVEYEQKQVSATWLNADELDVKVSAAPLYRQQLLAEAQSAIEQSGARRGHAALLVFFDHYLRFGARDEQFRVMLDLDTFVVRLPLEVGSKSVYHDEKPPSPATRRVWQRMLATRPQPK